jgi:hypothetical protein
VKLDALYFKSQVDVLFQKEYQTMKNLGVFDRKKNIKVLDIGNFLKLKKVVDLVTSVENY